MDDKLKSNYMHEYREALQRFYPELEAWNRNHAAVHYDVGGPGRYHKPTARPRHGIDAWKTAHFRRFRRRKTISASYKGLLFHKPPVDLMIYQALIWELQPATIVELGSFHGGSGLWFADQMNAMCEHGTVHSFDYLLDCVSPRAKGHPRLQFHKVDLNHLETFDVALLQSLPHPWLVVEDAHTNVLNVLTYLRGFMEPGDYFVKEDTSALGPELEIDEYLGLAESEGFLVDSIYCDAFGLNYTTAYNTWFVLSSDESGRRPPGAEPLRNVTWESLEGGTPSFG